MYTRLLSFINENGLLYKYQFGFREGHSPNLAIIFLVDKISNALEEGDYVLGLFLDFSKAFDTVNHGILFDKLEFYGIRGTALNWFKSYLNAREQYVVFDGAESARKRISCGVPQGSILGPLLFLVYINDLALVSDKLFSLLFADDSNMFLNGKDPDLLVETMNDEMKKMITWLKANKLSLNLKKTHYILFRKRRGRVLLSKTMVIDNIDIENVKHSKFLGVIIDERLTFNNHIQYMKGKISRAMGILYKCRKYLNQSTLLTLYNAFIYPYFTYCIPVWGNTCESYLKPLFNLQKRAVRIIANAEFRAHTDPLFKNLKILNVTRLHTYFVQLFVYNYNHNLLPDMFRDFFIQNSSIHNYPTRIADDFRPPIMRGSQACRTVRCFGVTTFNYFIDRIRMNCSYCTYKRHLKDFLLNNEIPFLDHDS